MKVPTSHEIHRAWGEIDNAGPAAPATLELAILAIKDPTLKAVIGRMRNVAFATPHSGAAIEAFITGALIHGLNMGMRIGEARATSQEPKP